MPSHESGLGITQYGQRNFLLNAESAHALVLYRYDEVVYCFAAGMHHRRPRQHNERGGADAAGHGCRAHQPPAEVARRRRRVRHARIRALRHLQVLGEFDNAAGVHHRRPRQHNERDGADTAGQIYRFRMLV